MVRHPPRSTRTATLFPSTSLFRPGGAGVISLGAQARQAPRRRRRKPERLPGCGQQHEQFRSAAPEAIFDIDDVDEGEHRHRQAPGGREVARFGRAAPPAPTKAQCDRRQVGEYYQAEDLGPQVDRSEEHTSELQSLMRISYAVFCLKKKKK